MLSFAVSLAVLGLAQGGLGAVANFGPACSEIQQTVSGASQVFFPGKLSIAA
jgi:hypothetical protein